MPDQILVARVLNEDKDFITLEVGKHDGVEFTLAQGMDPDAAPDRFHTIVFVHSVEGKAVPWLPWEE